MGLVNNPGFDVSQYVTIEDRGEPGTTWYAVDPATMYPAMLDYIQGQVEQENRPGPSYLVGLYDWAKRLPGEAWAWARIPRQEVEGVEVVGLRATALEIARLWFTELLHASSSTAKIGVHILADDRWRL